MNTIAAVSGPSPDATLLTAGRLPKLDAVAFGIHDPAETAIVILLNAVINLHPFFPKLRQQAVEVFHAIIDHERRRARFEVFRVVRKGSPDSATFSLGSVGFAPMKRDLAILLE